MKKIKVFILLIIFLFILFDFTFVYANSNEKLFISKVYEENNTDLIYFDISYNKLCISYENDKIYEYNLNGDFLRIINYESSGNIYCYYLEGNLVIFDLRKNIHIVLDDDGNVIGEKIDSKIDYGYYIGESSSEGFEIEQNGYKCTFLGSNWFSRVFLGKRNEIIIYNNNNIILHIVEHFNIIEEFIPLIIISVILLSFFIVKKIYIKKSKKIE